MGGPNILEKTFLHQNSNHPRREVVHKTFSPEVHQLTLRGFTGPPPSHLAPHHIERQAGNVIIAVSVWCSGCLEEGGLGVVDRPKNPIDTSSTLLCPRLPLSHFNFTANSQSIGIEQNTFRLLIISYWLFNVLDLLRGEKRGVITLYHSSKPPRIMMRVRALKLLIYDCVVIARRREGALFGKSPRLLTNTPIEIQGCQLEGVVFTIILAVWCVAILVY